MVGVDREGGPRIDVQHQRGSGACPRSRPRARSPWIGVVGGEEGAGTVDAQEPGVRSRGAGVQVPHELGAGGGAVGQERLLAEGRGRSENPEDGGAARPGERDDPALHARVQVRVSPVPSSVPSLLPDLPAMDAVVGDEVEHPAEVDQRGGVRGAGAGADVADQVRPGEGAVARPELLAVDAVVGGEEDEAAGGLHLVPLIPELQRGVIDVDVADEESRLRLDGRRAGEQTGDGERADGVEFHGWGLG